MHPVLAEFRDLAEREAASQRGRRAGDLTQDRAFGTAAFFSFLCAVIAIVGCFLPFQQLEIRGGPFGTSGLFAFSSGGGFLAFLALVAAAGALVSAFIWGYLERSIPEAVWATAIAFGWVSFLGVAGWLMAARGADVTSASADVTFVRTVGIGAKTVAVAGGVGAFAALAASVRLARIAGGPLGFGHRERPASRRATVN